MDENVLFIHTVPPEWRIEGAKAHHMRNNLLKILNLC